MMQSDTAGLKIRERWRKFFRSVGVVLGGGLLAALAVWMLVSGVDPAGAAASQFVGRKYIFPAGAIALFFAAFLCVFGFFPVPRSSYASGIRFSVFIIRKHLPVFLGIAVLVPVLAYVVFFMLAENETAVFDRNFSLLAKEQIRQISDWKDRQSAWAVAQAGLSGEAGIFRQGQRLGVTERQGLPERLQTVARNGRPDADGRKPVTETAAHDMSHVLKSRRIWMGPPKRISNADGTWRDVLTMYVPFMKETSAGPEAGVRLHYVNPAESLIPVMSIWPTSGMTSRVFLFSTRGGEVAMLRSVPTGRIAYPIEQGDVGHGQWLEKIGRTRQGIFHTVDHRGKRVVGYVGKIPDSDWSLMVKMDEREAYGHIRQMAWYILLMATLLTASAALVLFFVLRHRHMQYQTVRMKNGLKQRALRHDYLSRFANDAIILMDDSGTVIEANERSGALFGKARSALSGKNIRTVFDPQDAPVFEERWQELKREKSLIFEAYGKHADGRIFPVEISSGIIDTAGKCFAQFIIRDVSEKKKADEAIWRHANFDLLTGLANRRMFQQRLLFETRKAQRTGGSVALMYLDLDRFKYVNDTMGHDVGDSLLKGASERISHCVRETDMVARLGGDEFTVILADLEDFRDVSRVAQSIRGALSQPFVIDGQSVHVSTSIGIAFYPEDAADVQELMKHADQAMYAAKKNGGNRYHYFTSSMQEAVRQRTNMICELRHALDCGQFETVFQPIASMKTGEIGWAEALTRWRHPVSGMMEPVTFVPLMEETGMIRAFGNGLFMETVRQAAKWRASRPDFCISLNLSPVQFTEGGIAVDEWMACLEELSLPPQSVVIEITEQLLAGTDASVVRKLDALHRRGVRVAIDDFGTGYSSLASLKKFSPDYMKIDRTFIRNLTAGDEDRTLCETMIMMAYKLDIAVVAEGVETPEQWRILSSLGCDYAQGYYISEPVEKASFGKLLAVKGCTVMA